MIQAAGFVEYLRLARAWLLGLQICYISLGWSRLVFYVFSYPIFFFLYLISCELRYVVCFIYFLNIFFQVILINFFKIYSIHYYFYIFLSN
jgi:hypothetical protein